MSDCQFSTLLKYLLFPFSLNLKDDIGPTSNEHFLHLFSKIPKRTSVDPSPSQESSVPVSSDHAPSSPCGQQPQDPADEDAFASGRDHSRHKKDKLVRYDESLRIVSAKR